MEEVGIKCDKKNLLKGKTIYILCLEGFLKLFPNFPMSYIKVSWCSKIFKNPHLHINKKKNEFFQQQ